MESRTRTFTEGMVEKLRADKALGEKAIAQISDEQLNWKPSGGDNSIYNIVRHLHGNMLSRFTGFPDQDGEKSWRDREGEFAEARGTRQECLRLYAEGFRAMEQALAPLSDGDLQKTVTIRGEPHTVFQALVRQLSHHAYHVGQIVYIAKMLKAGDWKSLSIPRGASVKFDHQKQEGSSPEKSSRT
jgi:hypothetical protein